VSAPVDWNPTPEQDPEPDSALATLAAHLAAIAARGQPAYVAEAVRLRAAVLADPADVGARRAAEALVDAVLHDPYLTRFPAPGPSTRR
jgi:hypothetical protein